VFPEILSLSISMLISFSVLSKTEDLSEKTERAGARNSAKQRSSGVPMAVAGAARQDGLALHMGAGLRAKDARLNRHARKGADHRRATRAVGLNSR
jgi:hypothetical protein